jgi:hypothetical protein
MLLNQLRARKQKKTGSVIARGLRKAAADADVALATLTAADAALGKMTVKEFLEKKKKQKKEAGLKTSQVVDIPGTIDRALGGSDPNNAPSKLLRDGLDFFYKMPEGVGSSVRAAARRPKGTAKAYAEGLRSGTEGLARRPYNQDLGLGGPAQALGMAHRAIANPADAVGGVISSVMQRALKNRKPDIDDTAVEKANRAAAPANPGFQKQLQAAQQ